MLGAIADDFTGATDLATALVARGFRTVVTTGLPPADRFESLRTDADAVVIALKSRTAPRETAVHDSRAALAVLRELGATRVYDKYCSTFDSTENGNIGPVLDALATDLGVAVTVVVPSFPDAQRTVYQGHLFVGTALLSDSPMRHHPLTPMTDSDVARVLSRQSRAIVTRIGLDVVRRGAAKVRQAIAASARDDGHLVAIVIDATNDDDLTAIAQATAHLTLITGGSGLALGLDGPHRADPSEARLIRTVPGFRAVLAGSASEATRGQVRHARSQLPHHKLDLSALHRDLPGEVGKITAWACSAWEADADRPVLVCAVDPLEDIRSDLDEPTGRLIEAALGACAVAFTRAGARQFVVAGGETSGAVMAALGVRELKVGPAICPGVAWAAGTAGHVDDIPLNLVLKSGNFGGSQIMANAWEQLL